LYQEQYIDRVIGTEIPDAFRRQLQELEERNPGRGVIDMREAGSSDGDRAGEAVPTWQEQKQNALEVLDEELAAGGIEAVITLVDSGLGEAESEITAARSEVGHEQEILDITEESRFFLQIYEEFISGQDDPDGKLRANLEKWQRVFFGRTRINPFSRERRAGGGLGEMLANCEAKYEEYWDNKEWRGRFLAGSVISMLQHAPESVLNTHAAWRDVKASTPDGTQNESFWAAIDALGSRHTSTPELRLEKIMGLLQELTQNGVDIPRPERSSESVEDYQQRMERLNSAEGQAEQVKEMERQLQVVTAELQALWPNLDTQTQEAGLSLLGNGPRFTGRDIPGYIRQYRDQLRDFNDNRASHQAANEVMQLKQVSEQLLQVRQDVVDRINANRPGEAGKLLLEAEIEQRANGMAPGRLGQSERPNGQVGVDERKATSVTELNDASRQSIVEREGPRRRRRQMDQLLQSLQGMGGASPMDIQRTLDNAGYTRSVYEASTEEHTTSSEKVKIGDVVLNVVHTAMGKTALGLSNVEFDTQATDRLVATKEGIERTNLSSFDGKELLDDRMGVGSSVKLHLVTESGDVYLLTRHKDAWMLNGYPTVGKKVEQPLTDDQIRQMRWQKGKPVLDKLVNGSGPLKDIHLVYGNTRDLAKDKEIKKQLAKVPAGGASPGGAGAQHFKQWEAQAPFLRRWGRKTLNFLSED
jgi:hypothetical protein